MRLMTLLIIGELLVACAGAPQKPQLTICIVDWPRQEAICGETSSHLTTKEIYEAKSPLDILANTYRVPLSQMDKGTVLTPLNWEKAQSYIHLLEDYVQNRCSAR